ncbi:Modification methylase HphIA [Colletotrichum spinosum]|uniref:DNA (cytosine-5-)-methyltransferase n=1 Tax=Colletotrichum spinosum TaxID=1347390 RepID=A0A4R8QFE5_9PEZI|nr:Modification methylase HphIA [Colletotrichum spinosum]
MPPRGAGSTREDAIVIDYEEPVSSAREREVVDLAEAVRNYRPRRDRQSFGGKSDDIDEERQDDLASLELAEIIDLTVDDEPVAVRRPRKPRRKPVPTSVRHLSRFVREDYLLIKENKLYEIDLDLDGDRKSAARINFIFVTSITENIETHAITVIGIPYCRSRSLFAKLPRKVNEIFELYELDEEDDRSAEAQARVEVAAAALLRPRTLHKTNAPYPRHRYSVKVFNSLEAVKKEGPLVCRWKFFLHYRTAKLKEKRRAHHWTLERVRADDVTRDEFRFDEGDLRLNWRGPIVPGGSHRPEARGSDSQSVDKQKYTVLDSFSGAGGFSRGAERAGLHVKFAVDHWDKACDSYRLNFPGTELYQMSIDEFLIEKKDVAMFIDVLHLSPPCQTWSPAHTIPGVNDEANVAALFACRHLVEKLRPRIFTLEQTFGILQRCHDPFFCILVGGFTELGYSVTWKIVHLQTWGLPQTRKRLIMIGACPGERLPPFPTATHSETGAGGLSRYVTIRQALSKIDDTSTFHNPDDETRDNLPMGSVVSDPDEILRRCVTCSGGQNMHWSNTRAYTVREFASLQGFPVWHKFAPTAKSKLKKQIGNAFPACVVRLLCEHLKNWLLQVDGLVPQRASRASVGGRELIFVSESHLALPSPMIAPVPQRMAPLSIFSLEMDGDSPKATTVVDDEPEQAEIKFDPESDADMVDAPDYPGSPRSATLSLPSTPVPELLQPAGGNSTAPIWVLD